MLRRALATLALALLTACGGGGDSAAGPGGPPTGGQPAASPVRVEPASAAPFEVVSVRGLPAGYAAAPLRITVGGEPTMLTPDSGGAVYRFVVPGRVAAGTRAVALPAQGGAAAWQGPLTVAAPQYAGGTPEAAVASLDTLLAVTVADLSGLLAAPGGTGDPALTARAQAVVTIFERVRRDVATLSPADRAQFAAMISAHRAAITAVVAPARMVAQQAALAPATRSAAAGARAPLVPEGGAAPSASLAALAAADALPEYAGSCDSWVRSYDTYKLVAESVAKLSRITGMLGIFDWVPPLPAFIATVTGLSILTDLTGMMIQSTPFLLEPNGLTLTVAPAHLPAGGGDARLTATVRRYAPGGQFGNVVGLGGTMASEIVKIRAEAVLTAQTARRLFAQALLDYTFQALGELIAVLDANVVGQRLKAEGPTGVSRLRVTGPDLLMLPLPNNDNSALKVTALAVSTAADQPVTLSGELNGSENGCTAFLSPASPATGVNGLMRTREQGPVDVAGLAGSWALVAANGKPLPAEWFRAHYPHGPSSILSALRGNLVVRNHTNSDPQKRTSIYIYYHFESRVETAAPGSPADEGGVTRTGYLTLTDGKLSQTVPGGDHCYPGALPITLVGNRLVLTLSYAFVPCRFNATTPPVTLEYELVRPDTK